MIEHLRRALEHVDALSPEAQEDLAAYIEEQAFSATGEPSASPSIDPHLPACIRAALAAIGSASDLLDDDEFDVLDRIRHTNPPSPPVELDDL